MNAKAFAEYITINMLIIVRTHEIHMRFIICLLIFHLGDIIISEFFRFMKQMKITFVRLSSVEVFPLVVAIEITRRVSKVQCPDGNENNYTKKIWKNTLWIKEKMLARFFFLDYPVGFFKNYITLSFWKWGRKFFAPFMVSNWFEWRWWLGHPGCERSDGEGVHFPFHHMHEDIQI